MLKPWPTPSGPLVSQNTSLLQGSLNAQGTGSLHIDRTHRLEGRIDLTASGLAPVLQRYGIAPQLLDIGGLIGGLLTGRAPAHGPGQIRLPIVFDRGQLGLGPLRGVAQL